MGTTMKELQMKNLELEQGIRNANKKATVTGDEVCSKCLNQPHKQQFNDKIYTKKCLDNTIRHLWYHCECDNERMIIDGDKEICGNCGILQLDQVY